MNEEKCQMLSKNIQEGVMARNIFAPPSSTHA
jgi:hypothetical protein